MNNLKLRKLEREDFPLFYKWWNDPELRELTSRTCSPISEKEVDEILTKHLTNENYFDCIIEIDGQPIGHILIEKTKNNKAKFYIAIGEKEFWDKGYGTLAIQKSCEDFLSQYPDTIFELEVNLDNPRAIRAYEKAGFKKVSQKQEKDQKEILVMIK